VKTSEKITKIKTLEGNKYTTQYFFPNIWLSQLITW